jgi:hypothetical protein
MPSPAASLSTGFGEGAYAGLIAIFEVTAELEPCDFDVRGITLTGRQFRSRTSPSSWTLATAVEAWEALVSWLQCHPRGADRTGDKALMAIVAPLLWAS